jgi:hypothetical protein
VGAVTAHQTALQWLGDNWVWVLLAFWFVAGGTGEGLRRLLRERRQHQLNMAYARQGLPPSVIVRYRDEDDEDEWDDEDEEDEALPAAVIPAPPSARPVRGVPGPCRHEKIIPVIGDDGEHKRWICANFQRCEAVFDKAVAVYEPGQEP